MMSHALYLNSRDANTTTSDGSEAWFVLNNAGLMRRPGARFHIQVESITLPQAFYQTVRSGVNDAFAATVTDLADTPLASAVLTIVPGDYSASQLITAISTQWLASVLEASRYMYTPQIVIRISPAVHPSNNQRLPLLKVLNISNYPDQSIGWKIAIKSQQ